MSILSHYSQNLVLIITTPSLRMSDMGHCSSSHTVQKSSVIQLSLLMKMKCCFSLRQRPFYFHIQDKTQGPTSFIIQLTYTQRCQFFFHYLENAAQDICMKAGSRPKVTLSFVHNHFREKFYPNPCQWSLAVIYNEANQFV